ncbi:hypothetical protein CUMW_213850 [Citrus unshiu]|uniref:Leucine-rich repeat-containing N-terminal plant-type domain-containing protein n=1 Tax=Citrus unshiu TaxID=55188 RepID=A0A2H5QBD2_CITUN|nr:hypothetical protein CUMW_213850 [Citrus unshiu]
MESKRVSFSLIIVLFCSFFFTVVLSTAERSLEEVETEALKAFKNGITSDTLGALADWNDTNQIHHCNWSGITCNSSSKHVTAIKLVDKQLQGQISPFLGNLSALQVLDLSLNSFSGSIPAQLGQCSQLAELTLYYNSLSGSIPPEI